MFMKETICLDQPKTVLHAKPWEKTECKQITLYTNRNAIEKFSLKGILPSFPQNEDY